MTTVTIMVVAACGLLWAVALVEFCRTLSVLSRFRAMYGKVLGAK